MRKKPIWTKLVITLAACVIIGCQQAIVSVHFGTALLAKETSIYDVFKVTLSANSKAPLITKKPQLTPVRQHTIMGTITNGQNGVPLLGANVIVKGTRVGTSTDSSGHYKLDAPSLQDTLVCVFAGFQTREIPINGRTKIDVSLKPRTLPGKKTSRPNILFILADDMRPDAIQALGNPRIETPNIDRLVSMGTSFTRAISSSPLCLPSRAEILTGLHGWSNQAKLNEISTWPETLQNAGYTAWVVGKWHHKGRPSPLTLGFTKVAGLFSGGGAKYWKEGQRDWKGVPITGYRGWVFQNADGKTKYPEIGVGLTSGISKVFADSAISLINRRREQPWFGQVNFTVPHDPLLMPPGMKGKYKRSEMRLPVNYLPMHPFNYGNFSGRDEKLLSWPRTKLAIKDVLRVYYSVIDYMDTQIGRILTTLKETGQLDNTIIIFSSDHGLGLGSHGIRGKQNMYEHTINVPLIIAGPGIEAGSKTNAQVYLRELYPTTSDLIGIDIPKRLDGSSFAAVLQGETDTHHKNIYGYFKDSERMVRTADGWKLIRYPKIDYWQLFNLNNDPFELRNLVDSNSPVAQRKFNILQHHLAKWRHNQGDPLVEK